MGGDHLVNVIQWEAMVGEVVRVSYFDTQLGSHSGGQALAAVLAAEIPMGIV